MKTFIITIEVLGSNSLLGTYYAHNVPTDTNKLVFNIRKVVPELDIIPEIIKLMDHLGLTKDQISIYFI